jgi:ribulose-phosphate 3-epimerase
MNDLAQSLRLGAPHLSVGIATADQLHLADELQALAAAGVHLIHIDVMDGVFCPPATTAAPSLARGISPAFTVDVHLLVDDPLRHVDAWVDAGAGIVTFQLEGTRHAHRILQALADRPVVRGVGLTPSSPVCLLTPLIDDLELVLLLAVNPGWSGQRFRTATVERMREVRELLAGRDVLLAVDGAVPRDGLASQLVAAGADVVVSGSSIFDGDPRENAQTMRAQLAREPVEAPSRPY